MIIHQLQIISRTDLLDANPQIDQRNDFTPVAEADSYYPITKVLWEPRKVSKEKRGCIVEISSDIFS